MKKIIAVLSIAALVLSLAACGGKSPEDAASTTETVTEELTTDPSVTEPEVGRISEKETFYVYIPEHWCKMEYTGDDTRLRLFDIPSAPKIEEGKTPEVEIRVAAKTGSKADVDAAVAELLKNEGAKKGKAVTVDGEAFTVVTYTDANEKRPYTVYVGLGGGSLATLAFKGMKMTDEEPAAILRSISFKSAHAREEWSSKVAEKQKAAAAKTTTTAAAKTTKAATTAAAKTTTAAAKTTTAAAKTTKAATTAVAKTTTAAAKTTKAATTAAAKTTASAKTTVKSAG